LEQSSDLQDQIEERNVNKRIAVLLFSGLLSAVAAFGAGGVPPTINITGPTGTIFVSSFPFSANITMQISHPDGLENLQVFDVQTSRVSPNPTSYADLTQIGNPFDQNGACSNQMIPGNQISGCFVSSGVATVSVMWQVPSAGTYSVQVTLKYKGADGIDTQEATFALLLGVEYPAPPAIANAFINANPSLKKASPTVRGCVVSQIAQLHGQFQKYNPAPGPYNNPLVQSDVVAFWPACSTK
jgi:hypothetical protein